MIHISMIGAANRPKWWWEVYNSIHTKLNFEIIFVGDVRPSFELELPKNFKYIYSPVKPTQCNEIARRQASGELIHILADDTTYNRWCFDYAYDLYKKSNDYKTMICFRAIEIASNGGPIDDKTDLHYLFGPDFNGPKVAPQGLISRQFLNELGGFDRNFIAGNAENDIAMRAYAAGGTMKISDWSLAFNDERKHEGVQNLKETAVYETNLLKKLWLKDGKIIFERGAPFESFEEKDLLFFSQGEKGKWI